MEPETKMYDAQMEIVARKIFQDLGNGLTDNDSIAREMDETRKLVEVYADDWESRYLLLCGAYEALLIAYALFYTRRKKYKTILDALAAYEKDEVEFE
jgi:hypothetical protein